MTAYELQSLKLPKLTGAGLSAFTAAVENPASRALLLGRIVGKRRHTQAAPDHAARTARLFYPLVPPEPGSRSSKRPSSLARRQKTSPYQTARATMQKLTGRGPSARWRQPSEYWQAIEASEQGRYTACGHLSPSTAKTCWRRRRLAQERIRSGHPLSLLDGVPVAVKDEIDMKPYPTTVGTRFLGAAPAAEDSTVVARLRAAGALLVGKANMHEIGINPNGANAHYGMVRNPYDVRCDPGGSSSGSSAAVAAGLVPVAIGADGGGSIRIPAALCGIVGLKSTFGRVSEFGAAPLCWSVAHLGPLTASVEDAALTYGLVAGPDPSDPNTLVQPPVTLAGWNRTDLHGVRLGVYRDWFEHAAPEVVQTCKAMLETVKSAGAEI